MLTSAMLAQAARHARRAPRRTFARLSEAKKQDEVELYVGNLPREATAKSVREAFSLVCVVRHLDVPLDRVSGRCRGYAFLTVDEATDVEFVSTSMRKSKIAPKGGLEVTLASARKPRLSFAAAINAQLKDAETAVAVLDVFERKGSDFNRVNLASALQKLGKCPDASNPANRVQLQLLVKAATDSLQGGTWSARDVANACWGLAKVQGVDATAFFASASASAVPLLSSFNAMELANSLWAFSTAARGTEANLRLLEAAAEVIPAQIDSFNSHDLSVTAGCYAKAGVAAPAVFSAVARESAKKISTFNSQSLANTAWAFAHAKVEAPELFQAVAAQAVKIMPTFQGQAISQLLWALATAGFYSPTVFEKAAKRALNQSSLFTPTAVAKTVWAFATARVPATDLFEAFTQDALRKMKGVNAKDLATTAWAYASASVEAPALFEAIASEATRRSNLLQASECATLVWACAEAGVTKPAFYDAVATPLSLHLATLTSKEVANIVWAYSKAGCRANALFESAALTLDASELDTVALSRTAWAYATARFPAPELLEAISVDVAARADFSPAMLAEVAWAFAVLGAAGPQVEKALENIADSATRPRFTQTEVATLAWSFATLGVVPHGLFDCLAKQLAFDDVEDTDLVKLQVASLFLLQAAPGHALTALLAQHEDSLRRAALAEVRFGERSRKQLSRLLVKLGWAHEASFFTDEGLRIDFAHESRHGKVALGFANVDDYLVGAGAERVLDGPAKCKDALLQASGWHVVRLPFYEWNPLETFDAKEAYLRGKVDIPEKAV